MVFPKPIMTVSELEKMGFSKTQLYDLARSKGQKCCFRNAKSGSKIFIDTQRLEKELYKNLHR